MEDTMRSAREPVPSSWTLMETRLVSAKVHDLLEEAGARLSKLATTEDLPADTLAALMDTLHSVRTGAESIRVVREHSRRARHPAGGAEQTAEATVLHLDATG